MFPIINLALFVLIIHHVSLTNAEPDKAKELRLPSDLSPSHYLIRLQPFLDGNFSFSGHIEISLNVSQETNQIILHMNDIITKNDTTKVYETNSQSSELSISKQEYVAKKQFYIVTLKEKLKQGTNYVISLDYEGYLNEDMAGFYRSTYTDSKGNAVYLAASDFEPTNARKAFPCFDEPSFKARYTIEIIRPEGLRAISNMPRYDSKPVEGQAGWFLDQFNTSFPMSSYLVAFVISDFSHLQANDTNGFYFRVWTRKEALSTAEYAIKIGPPILKFYEQFFNVPFPLPKQDMIAIPDFASGGMENWGLITYRESALLYHSKLAKAKDKMRIASVIAHELAHMWFGDLVSPKWWTDLWLNEGFASYVQYIGLTAVEPTMRALDQFVIEELHLAFQLDSLKSSHPIWVEVNDPEEITQIFDSITYSKGASIIRMMNSFLTDLTFRNGLQKYLTELSYSNAKQEDLWKYLTQQGHADQTLPSNITVKDVMDSWTLQTGYPVVTITRSNDGTATLTQKRFNLMARSDNDTESDTNKWWIPITFTTQNNPLFNISTPKYWLTPTDKSRTIEGMPNNEKWVIFNLEQAGYYRVNYDNKNWNSINQQLRTDNTVISNINKAQILDDILNLARSGHVNYQTALDIVSYLKNEKEYVPIKAAFDNLDYIKRMLTYTGSYGLFKNYLLSIIIPIYQQIGFADSLTDAHLDQRKRAEILKWACDLGYPQCVENAKNLFSKWMNSPENETIISPNLKSIVYCNGIREGGDKEWFFVWNQYRKSSLGTEQKELLEAMACSKSVWILSEFLNRSITPDRGIKKQMVDYIIPAVARTEIGRYVTWNFIRNKWSIIVKNFGSLSFVLPDIISGCTESLNTKLQFDELQNFKAENSGRLATGQRAVEQALENTQINIHWMSKYYNVILKYLQNNYNNTIV